MSRSSIAGLLIVLTLAALPAAAGVGPYLVADLDTTPIPGSAFPGLVEWAELGGSLYFAADDGRHGMELWRTDGTLGGTRLVADLCPGPCSSSPGDLAVFNGRLAFIATDGFHGHEIWLSDGTRQGTLMPRDLCPGSCGGLVPGSTEPVVVGDRLFFIGRQFSGGYQLGVTDGTAEGTRWLTELRANPLSTIGEFKGRLAFLGPGTGGWFQAALWLSDGTPEGTFPAVDLCTIEEPCPSWNDATVVGDRIVFFPREQTWSSDGTAAGTGRIGDAKAAAARTLWKGVLYFSDFEGFWRSDGTPEGTVKLRSYPHTPPDNPTPFSPPRDFATVGDSLVFIAAVPSTGLALWRTKGTPGSVDLLFDPLIGPESPDLGPLTRVGDRLVFPVTSAAGTDLWETDGSTAGTRQVTPLCNTSEIRCAGDPQRGPLSPTALGQLYLFGLAEETAGTELWALDGGSVRRVRDIFRQPGSGRPGGVVHSEASGEFGKGRDIASLGARVVFSAKTAPQGPARLWATDGTAAGTAEIGSNVSWPSGLVRIGDRIWLRGSAATFSLFLFGREIWSTDGTAAGTRIMRTGLEVGSLLGGRPGLVLFAGRDFQPGETSGLELWASNGTAGGTGLLKDINTSSLEDDIIPLRPPSSIPGFFEPLGNNVLFAASAGVAGREPWITDGTSAGTRLLLDIHPALSSSPGPFVRFGGRAYFAANDGVRGREPWSTDGTAAGTTLVRDLRPGTAGSNPRDLVRMGSALYFLADSGASDGLWTISSNGQAKRIRLLAKGQRAASLVAANNRLFFVVDDPATGPELWTSAGTRAGTRRVLDIRPGAVGSFPQELAAVDDRLLFAADDGVHGLELWVSDGSAPGTRMLADLAPGAAASAPRSFTLAGDLVAFDADDGVHGRELWAISKADVAGDDFPAGGGGK